MKCSILNRSPADLDRFGETTKRGAGCSVVQNYIDEGAMNVQSFFELDETKSFELVHKEIDPWPRCADHFRQSFLTYLRDYRCNRRVRHGLSSLTISR